MLLIRNALSKGGIINIEDINFDQDIPQLKKDAIQVRNMDQQVAAIWNMYFELLFGSFHLSARITNMRNTVDGTQSLQDLLNKYFPVTTDKLFREYPFSKDFLLRILVDKPQKHAAEALIAGAGKKDPEKVQKEKVKSIIQKAFDYTSLSQKKGFSELIRRLNVNVCPYCGRMFTTTAAAKGHCIRANQVDHYYPKALFPFLGLSIWNWIPSCGPCNNRKSDNVDHLFLYPYEEAMGDDYRFYTHVKKGIGYIVGEKSGKVDFDISLEPTAACKSDNTKKTMRKHADYQIEKLGLNELYTTHTDYVNQVFTQRYVFSDAYLDSLISSFPDLFTSRADVRALLYMKRIEEENTGDAPLAKLTRDIDHEIDELIYGMSEQ